MSVQLIGVVSINGHKVMKPAILFPAMNFLKIHNMQLIRWKKMTMFIPMKAAVAYTFLTEYFREALEEIVCMV